MITSLSFFSDLNWIDGKPLVIEPYRQRLFIQALDERRPDGSPRYNMVLSGRGKKNFKSADLVLAGLYCLMCRESPQGSDALIVANDLSQAGDDLSLAKKLVEINGLAGPDGELEIFEEEIRRKDGRGVMRIIPAQNATGQHGRTAVFIGYDEIHGHRDWTIMEALQPDPTRECLQWITSYDTILDVDGQPLHDLKKVGIAGTDERMLFSWYSGDFCTDPAFMRLPPEARANPSMASWPEGRGYLDQQRRRLPSSKFRRLHLNLPGAVQGAFYDQGIVERAIVAGRQEIAPQPDVVYHAFVDMSGGSSDDATLGIAHWDGAKAVLDLLIEQADPVPFNPRLAVARFAIFCKRYRCSEVHGDAYAGQTFRSDFSDCGISYIVEKKNRTDIYEDLEVALNADQVELLDHAKLKRQLLTIVRRGASLDHLPGQHDDHVTAAAGALTLANPDLGAETPGILEFYRRQSEALTVVKPTPAASERFAFMQIGGAKIKISDPIRILVPERIDISSVIGGASAMSHIVEIEDGRRCVYVSRDDARSLLTTGNPTKTAWVEANRALAEDLRAGLPPAQPTISAADFFGAIEAMRPRSPFDKGGIARDALRACGFIR